MESPLSCKKPGLGSVCDCKCEEGGVLFIRLKEGTGEGFNLGLVFVLFYLVRWSSLLSHGVKWKSPPLPQHKYSLLILALSGEKVQRVIRHKNGIVSDRDRSRGVEGDGRYFGFVSILDLWKC